MRPDHHVVVAPGFHEGELAVQQEAGVRAEAARLSSMLDPADLGRAASFLAAQTFAVLSARDDRSRLWTSPVSGPPGFLEVIGPHTLVVHAVPAQGDPLHALPDAQPVGLLVIDFARRRRYRINGRLETAPTGRAGASGPALVIEADQAFGNCPQFIQARELIAPGPAGDVPAASPWPAGAESAQLTDEDVAQVTGADTFFLGTTHPARGNDASHRGGPPGFARVEDDRHLWWPDYPGNNMFNSLGNLAVDPTAALLFCDFGSGRTLHLSGTARALVTTPGASGDDGGSGRRVVFTLERAQVGPPMPLRADRTSPYPRNPGLT